MAVLLQIRNAHKSYGGQVLLDGADASITDDVKVGFVGRNGTGKSTLLKILLGEEDLDSGDVIRHPKLRLGYLRQHDAFQPEEPVLEFLMRDSGQPDWKCGEVAGQFELKGAYLEGPIGKLSGGWQTRVKLAALLLHSPNLLLLDEPTNFLDLRTQILLEHFLRGYEEACLIVSHDRGFLGATCDHTLELARGKLTMFPGKIDAYLENQVERRAHDERANAAVMAKRRHLEEFIAKNKARASTATRAKSKEKQLEKLDTVDIAADEPTVSIRAPQVEPRRGAALRCVDVTIGYPERTIASDIRVDVDHGMRAAVVGDNGQGKTTFLRTIVDSLPALTGEVRWGHGCSVGIYAQHVYSSLPPKQTVLEFLENTAPAGTKMQEVLNGAASLLFRGGDVKKKISVLSGGERARLCLAGLMLSQHNILVLDEPGNHLDVETVDSLAEALLAYKGTIIFTSHDRHFMKRLATTVIEVRDGRVINYQGNYDSYVYAVNKEIEAGERELATRMSKAPAEALAARGKPAKRNDRDARKELGVLEKTIARLDDQKKTVNARLLETTDPHEAMQLHSELEEVQQQLTEAEDRWCALQEELGEWG
ncbi:MAG: ABC-F family ATP-binding cassette domain-containing protein [Planctomyces sp.]|nr:ABC-F family ATP-binding cassette domain-containing protein [Planctomyces sp.]